MSGVAKLVFEVPGPPRGKGRHRAGRIINGPKKGMPIQRADLETVSYEAQVKWFARQAMGAHGIYEPLKGPLWMKVTSFHLPNKQEAKAMEKEPHRLHYCMVKPDGDNILKIIADSLNGLVYRDDAVIADGSVVKRLGTNARVVVSIGQLTD